MDREGSTGQRGGGSRSAEDPRRREQKEEGRTTRGDGDQQEGLGEREIAIVNINEVQNYAPRPAARPKEKEEIKETRIAGNNGSHIMRGASFKRGSGRCWEREDPRGKRGKGKKEPPNENQRRRRNIAAAEGERGLESEGGTRGNEGGGKKREENEREYVVAPTQPLRYDNISGPRRKHRRRSPGGMLRKLAAASFVGDSSSERRKPRVHEASGLDSPRKTRIYIYIYIYIQI